MKALSTIAPGEYRLIEKPVPTPLAGEVLIKVNRAALSPSDVWGADRVQYPITPGHEFAGVVEKTGPGVANVIAGDRVAVYPITFCGRCYACQSGDTLGCEQSRWLGWVADGGFAEYCVVPSQNLFKMPDHLALDEGALLEPLATAVALVKLSEVRQGDRVVILGPDPIGLLALQVARLAGPAVLILAGTREERLSFGKELGATHIVNLNKSCAPQQLREILRNEGSYGYGAGADVVIESSGTAGALTLAMDLIGWRGRIGIKEGYPAGEPVTIVPQQLLAKSATLKFVSGYVSADFATALKLASKGQVNLKSIITHSFPLAEWEKAFEVINKNRRDDIKIEFIF